MADSQLPEPPVVAATGRRSRLVPRLKDQGYTRDLVERRRKWAEETTGADLPHVGSFSIPSEEMRGNIENPIGAVQMPLGVAGPLLVHGHEESDVVYVPLATTEGALVRSYERGMVALTKSDGAKARVHVDENRISPVFTFDDIGEAHKFVRELPGHLEALRGEADGTTRHGRLLRVEPHPVGRDVIVSFCFFTADAHGMNMIVKATDEACRWLLHHTDAKDYFIFSGYNSEKRASGALLAGGKGKKVTAGGLLTRAVVRGYLHTTPEQIVEVWRRTVVGHLQAGAYGYNGHYANGLTAMFIACGQDVANVANSSVGITQFELTDHGDLYASVTLPSLTIATVGGGTGLGTGRECLEMLGCAGAGRAVRFAEIVAATLLGGELSMAAAIGSGEFVQAHESYGRNRPTT